MRKRKIINLIFIILSAVIILVPALLTNLKPDQISVSENRKLAEPSSLSEGWSVYSRSLNSAINDRIGLREQMLGLYSELRLNVLQSRNEQVIVGEDGWLFLAEDLPDYTGQTNTVENLELCVSIVKKMDAWCKEHGSQFVFVLGPNKTTIYHEYMPDYIRKAEITFLDTLTERLEREGILVVNPKEALLEDADDIDLYFRLDTHWNCYGSKYALDELVAKLGLPVVDFTITERREKTGDLLTMLSVPPNSVEGESLFADVLPNPECNKETDLENLCIDYDYDGGESFICFRDSFTSNLEDYYTYYFDGPMYSSWDISRTPLDEFPPYFIFSCVERNIMRSMSQCAAFFD